MTKVIIIGNGFDLSLGLKTEYKDFINTDYFLCLLNDSSNYFCKHIYDKFKSANWIDIENEFKVFAKRCIERQHGDDFKREYKLLCSSLMLYLKSLDLSSINKESDAYRYLKKTIQIETGSYLKIYNFNYTETVNQILFELGYNETEISKILVKVHGSLNEKGIKFGVEESSRLDKWNQFLYKTHNDNVNQVNLDDFLGIAEQVEFFGHSLGETDHDYFTTFFRNTHNSRTKPIILIYKYNQDSAYLINEQLNTLTNGSIIPIRTVNRLKFYSSVEELNFLF